MHENKSCTVMTRASQLQSLAEDLQLAGVEGQTDGKLHVCSSGEGGTGGKDLPVCTCTCNDVVLKSYPNLASH